MVLSKYFEDELSKAKGLIDAGAFDEAVTVLSNLKGRMIPQPIYTEADKHEKHVNDEYVKRVNQESKESGDPWERELVARSFIIKLESWRALEMLRFYSKLADQHSL